MKFLALFILSMVLYIMPSTAQVNFKFNAIAHCTMDFLEDKEDCNSKAVNASFYMSKEYTNARLIVNNITYTYRILDREFKQMQNYTLLNCSVMDNNDTVYLMAIHLLEVSPQVTIINLEDFSKIAYYVNE